MFSRPVIARSKINYQIETGNVVANFDTFWYNMNFEMILPVIKDDNLTE